MRKILIILTAISFYSQITFAACDFSTGISPLPDSGYRYSRECNLQVGIMKQDLEVLQQQANDFQKAIALKDIAIDKADKRADLWMNTSLKLEDKVQKIDELQKQNNWYWFAAGILVTGLAVWGAGQLRDH